MSAAGFAALNSSLISVFGQPVTYRPASGTAVAVSGILETGVILEDLAPGVFAVLFLRLADLAAAPATGDKVTIGTATYKVYRVEVDPVGGVQMALREE